MSLVWPSDAILYAEIPGAKRPANPLAGGGIPLAWLAHKRPTPTKRSFFGVRRDSYVALIFGGGGLDYDEFQRRVIQIPHIHLGLVWDFQHGSGRVGVDFLIIQTD
jgi:hypothetical protein